MKTSSQIANDQRCAAASIRRWAARLGIAKMGKEYVFTNDDEALILANLNKGRGNPNFVPGNEYGKLGGSPTHRKRSKA